MIIGILGMILVVAAWILETYDTAKKNQLMDIKFLILYIVAMLLMIVYSFQIADIIFITLNSIILVLILIELVIVIKRMRI